MARIIYIVRLLFLCLLIPTLCAAVPQPATQPALITLHAKDLPVTSAIAQLSKQASATLPLAKSDLLEKNPIPNLTLEIDHQPFWKAIELFSQKTGLEPVVSHDDPYPHFEFTLGGGAFWEEPHVVAGPLILFVNDVERSNNVELRKKAKHEFERTITFNFSAFAEPGLVVLWASPRVELKSAVDAKGRNYHAAKDAQPVDDEPDGANGMYTWDLSLALDCPLDAPATLAQLRAATKVRIQTASEPLEFENVLKARNVSKVVAGVPFTLRSLKTASDEYILQIQLRRDKASRAQWQDFYHSIYSGRLALYDEKSRLVAARGTEVGVEFKDNRLDATLRFPRDPASNPQAGEAFKLVWLAPTATRDLTVEFELHDLPIPQ